MECPELRLRITQLIKSGQKDGEISPDEQKHLDACKECVRWLFRTYGPIQTCFIQDGQEQEDPAQECLSCRVGFLDLQGDENPSHLPWHLHVRMCRHCQHAVIYMEALLRKPGTNEYGRWTKRTAWVKRLARHLAPELRRRALTHDLPGPFHKTSTRPD
ncbi:MAG: hypothetical protein WCV84_03090 [Patescibacteria group bacterium]